MANSAPFYNVGLHVGEIVRQGLTKASTGNKQLVLTIKVLGTPNEDGSYAPHQQQYERTIWMTATEKTMPYIVEKLKALDFKGTMFSQLDPGSTNHISMVGQQADFWCSHEASQQGGMREKWDVATGGVAKPLEALNAKEMRELDALFGKALGGPKTAAPAQVAQVAAQKTRPDGNKDYGFDQSSDGPPVEAYSDLEITDDDIPF